MEHPSYLECRIVITFAQRYLTFCVFDRVNLLGFSFYADNEGSLIIGWSENNHPPWKQPPIHNVHSACLPITNDPKSQYLTSYLKHLHVLILDASTKSDRKQCRRYWKTQGHSEHFIMFDSLIKFDATEMTMLDRETRISSTSTRESLTN